MADGSWSTGCPTHRDLESLTALVYGVPKLARGLALGRRRPPTRSRPTRRRFFRLLYNLLVDADRGPRLPTLILAVGARPGARPRSGADRSSHGGDT